MQNSTDRTRDDRTRDDRTRDDRTRSGQTASGKPERGSISVFVVCVVIGLAYLGIGLATGRTGFGAVGLGIMLAYALGLALLRRRSETAGLLSGDIRDERQALVLSKAAAFTGNVMITVVLGAFLWTLATGSELANVFAGLSAVGGVAFAAGVAVSARRT